MILITGCAGYIGKKLAFRLLEQGRAVRGLIMPNQMEEMEELVRMGLDLCAGDIGHAEDIKKAVSQVDVVYHLVGIHSSNKEKTYCVLCEGTKNLLDACRKEGIKRIILSSSGSVYGALGNEIITEQSELRPWSFYGQVVKEMEEIAQKGAYVYGIKILILRIAEVYGSDRNNYISKRTRSVLGSQDSYNSRIYIGDLINILVLCENSLSVDGIYNVSDNKPLKQIDFYRKLESITGFCLPEFIPLSQVDERIQLSIHGLRAISLRMSNDKLQRALSYDFLIQDISEGIHYLYEAGGK